MFSAALIERPFYASLACGAALKRTLLLYMQSGPIIENSTPSALIFKLSKVICNYVQNVKLKFYIPSRQTICPLSKIVQRARYIEGKSSAAKNSSKCQKCKKKNHIAIYKRKFAFNVSEIFEQNK